MKPKSAKAIKDELKALNTREKLEYIEALREDERKAVVKIVESVDKEKAKLDKEILRTEKMYELERNHLARGVKVVAGIDEVGRGPLAGPVVAACVILPEDEKILHLNDSKKINEKNREMLFEEIMEKAIGVGIGMADCGEIDQLNILNATKLAMKRSIEKLAVQPELLLIDAVELADIDIEQESMIKGDEKCASIAAASIIAKVTRDRMMVEYDKVYPHYDFASNKGYGTGAHYQGIETAGICDQHRKTFLKNIL